MNTSNLNKIYSAPIKLLQQAGMVAGLVLALPTHALTPAGTTIANQATLQFAQGNVDNFTATSNVASFVVQELIDVAVEWKDANAVPVGSPDTNRPLQFTVTNTGNGTQSYTLLRQPVTGQGQFTPVPAIDGNPHSLYIENGGKTGFQANGAFADKTYTAGEAIKIPAGKSITVYVASNIPANRNPNDTGHTSLQAQSANPDVANAPIGTNLDGAGIGGIDAVVAHGRAQDQGHYVVSSLVVKLSKSINRIQDTQGGNVLMSGAVVTYRISAQILGSGTAKNLTFSDTLPQQLRYKAGTLYVNGALQTDAADADLAEVRNNTVTVRAGDILAPAQFTITLQATVE